MSELKITIDKELIKEYRDYQIDSVLDKTDDESFKCYVLNRIFTKFPDRKEAILRKSNEFDWVEIDVITGQILQYDNNREHMKFRPKKLSGL